MRRSRPLREERSPRSLRVHPPRRVLQRLPRLRLFGTLRAVPLSSTRQRRGWQRSSLSLCLPSLACSPLSRRPHAAPPLSPQRRVRGALGVRRRLARQQPARVPSLHRRLARQQLARVPSLHRRLLRPLRARRRHALRLRPSRRVRARQRREPRPRLSRRVRVRQPRARRRDARLRLVPPPPFPRQRAPQQLSRQPLSLPRLFVRRRLLFSAAMRLGGETRGFGSFRGCLFRGGALRGCFLRRRLLCGGLSFGGGALGRGTRCGALGRVPLPGFLALRFGAFGGRALFGGFAFGGFALGLGLLRSFALLRGRLLGSDALSGGPVGRCARSRGSAFRGGTLRRRAIRGSSFFRSGALGRCAFDGCALSGLPRFGDGALGVRHALLPRVRRPLARPLLALLRRRALARFLLHRGAFLRRVRFSCCALAREPFHRGAFFRHRVLGGCSLHRRALCCCALDRSPLLGGDTIGRGSLRRRMLGGRSLQRGAICGRSLCGSSFDRGALCGGARFGFLSRGHFLRLLRENVRRQRRLHRRRSDAGIGLGGPRRKRRTAQPPEPPRRKAARPKRAQPAVGRTGAASIRSRIAEARTAVPLGSGRSLLLAPRATQPPALGRVPSERRKRGRLAGRRRVEAPFVEALARTANPNGRNAPRSPPLRETGRPNAQARRRDRHSVP